MSDYIKRKSIRKLYSHLDASRVTVPQVLTDIDATPSADVVERKGGEWIRSKEYKTIIGASAEKDEIFRTFWTYKCSECEEEYTDAQIVRYNFCPNCGAYMRAERKESE